MILLRAGLIDYIDVLFLLSMILVGVALWLMWDWLGALGWFGGLLISSVIALVMRQKRRRAKVQP